MVFDITSTHNGDEPLKDYETSLKVDMERRCLWESANYRSPGSGNNTGNIQCFLQKIEVFLLPLPNVVEIKQPVCFIL